MGAIAQSQGVSARSNRKSGGVSTTSNSTKIDVRQLQALLDRMESEMPADTKAEIQVPKLSSENSLKISSKFLGHSCRQPSATLGRSIALAQLFHGNISVRIVTAILLEMGSVPLNGKKWTHSCSH